MVHIDHPSVSPVFWSSNWTSPKRLPHLDSESSSPFLHSSINYILCQSKATSGNCVWVAVKLCFRKSFLIFCFRKPWIMPHQTKSEFNSHFYTKWLEVSLSLRFLLLSPCPLRCHFFANGITNLIPFEGIKNIFYVE